MPAVTISDLARRLGLSESTVSKALNDRPDVSASVKERVRAEAASLGYTPNVTARKLALGDNRSIGVFLLNRFGRPAGEYFGFNFLGGLMKEAQERSLDLLLFSESPELSRTGYLEYARRKGVSGAVFIGLWDNDPQFRLLARDTWPWVSIDTPVEGSCNGFVSTDNRQGMLLVLEAAWEKGHREFGYIGIHGGGYVARERRRAYEFFCAEKGLPAINSSSLRMRETSLTMEAGRLAALEILSHDATAANAHRLPTALVCAADLQALGALRAARELGLSVPGDLAVTGFDNISASALSSPGLTTVAQDAEGIGCAAIASVMDGAERTEAVLVKASLIVRESL